MANVARHGSTHRFRFVGGTDPLNVELPGVYAVESSSVAITADGEFEWPTLTTNNDECFRWDDSDPAGILIQSDGWYAAFMTADVASIDAAVDRTARLRLGNVSGGSTGEFGDGVTFNVGKGGVDSGSPLPTVQEPATRLWEIALTGLFAVDPEDPARVALFFNHMGSNFTQVNTRVFIWRVATLDGFGAPMKWEATP